jgi:hypothetical protein
VTGRRLSFNARADEYRLARPPYPERVYAAPDRLAPLDAIGSLVDSLGGTVLDPHITAVYLAPRA